MIGLFCLAFELFGVQANMEVLFDYQIEFADREGRLGASRRRFGD
jgi:hypothetical protein